MVAKVCSWCGSRLGASAAMAASKTPPRRGVSWPPTGAGTNRAPSRATTTRPMRNARWARISVLREPDVLELLVREVTRRCDPVLHLGPVHDVARPPETGDVVGVLQHDFLKLDDQLPTLDPIERPRPPREEVVDRGGGGEAACMRGPGD